MAADNHEWEGSGHWRLGHHQALNSRTWQQREYITALSREKQTNGRKAKRLFWWWLTSDQWQIHAIYLTIISGFAKSAFLQVLWSHLRREITCKIRISSFKNRQNSWQIPGTSYVEWAFLLKSLQSTVLTIAVLKLGQPSKQDNIKYSDSW